MSMSYLPYSQFVFLFPHREPRHTFLHNKTSDSSITLQTNYESKELVATQRKRNLTWSHTCDGFAFAMTRNIPERSALEIQILDPFKI